MGRFCGVTGIFHGIIISKGSEVDTCSYLLKKYADFTVVPREYIDAEVGVTVSSLCEDEYMDLLRFVTIVRGLLNGDDVVKVFNTEVKHKLKGKTWTWKGYEFDNAAELANFANVSVSTVYAYRQRKQPLDGDLIQIAT